MTTRGKSGADEVPASTVQVLARIGFHMLRRRSDVKARAQLVKDETRNSVLGTRCTEVSECTQLRGTDIEHKRIKRSAGWIHLVCMAYSYCVSRAQLKYPLSLTSRDENFASDVLALSTMVHEGSRAYAESL
jgi:hypothetical protein